MRYEVTETMLRRASIPAAYWAVQLTNIEDRVLVSRMTKVLQDVPSLISTNFGVLILGAPCSGKTAFASLLLREAMRHGVITHYVRSVDLHSHWKGPVHHLDPSVTLGSKFTNADLVVLDDVGAESTNDDWVVRHLEFALRRRFENNKGTILVSNLGPRTIQKHYPPTLWSVIERVCKKQIVVENEQWRVQTSEY